MENSLQAPLKNNTLKLSILEGVERMLTMEQIYRIRYMKKFEGKSLRKISEITGHNIQTVKSM